MHGFLLKIYHKVLNYSNSKFAPYVLAIVAFTESIFFPIPPDTILIPMSLSKPKKALWYALNTTIFSVIGGCIGYLLGYFGYIYFGKKLITSLHYEHYFNLINAFYIKYGFWVVFIGAGFTPIPYKIITLFSGFIQMAFFPFLISSIISRGIRFFLISILIYFFGEKAKIIIEKHIGKITIIIILIILIIAYFLIFSRK